MDERRLRRLIDVSGGLLSNLELESVLNQLVELARELTGARYAALGILDEKRQELERFITIGIDEETRARIGDLPRGRGVLGELIRDPHPVRLSEVGDHPRSYGFPPGHPPMRTFLGVPVMIRGEAFGNLYLTEKQGAPFDEADEESALILADFAAIAIENARLYQQVGDRNVELERVLHRLEATTDVARALQGETELERVLELITKRGRAMVDARWLAILLEERGELVVAAAAGEVAKELLTVRLPLEGSVAGQVLRSGRPERVTDVGNRLTVSSEKLALDADVALFVPLVFRGDGLGILIAADKISDEARFTAEDERLLLSFAASAATAVNTAKSVASERLRHSLEASEQERARWARELHDETLQGLGGLQMLLSSALRRPEAGLSSAVEQAIAQLGIEIANLRNLITELRPAALDELGLVPALETLASRTASSEGLMIETNIALELERSALLGADIESTLYRLVQEALNNVAKHAGATRAEVRLVRENGSIEVTVSDDGKGFDALDPGPGFGLVGMRERVELAGGSLEIDSAPGEGTTLRAEIPLSSAGPAAAAQSA